MSRKAACRQPHHLKNSDLHYSSTEKAWPTISRCGLVRLASKCSEARHTAFSSISVHTFRKHMYTYIYIYENFIIWKPYNQQSSIVDNGMHTKSKQNNHSAEVQNRSRVLLPASAQVL
ncbi:hypothetical protein MTO96_049111 [Rhipicephalus appendiculatus]